ncbi:isoprenyl transferase [Desulfococcaceae bacterium HSG8]|nr:isoprenyl transferase [Desulfococcaceae bacterium HSG8]
MNSNTSPDNYAELDPAKIPAHVAIIMDGNGRWAKKRLANRVRGHEQGMEVVRKIVRACRKTGISILTLYAFSTENWQRPKPEVTALMALLKRFLKTELNEMMDNNIRLNAIGQTERLPEGVRELLHKTMGMTEKNDGMLLNLALSYGGRAELTRMVRDIAVKVKTGTIDPDSITPELISDHLYTGGMADPDLLIRTSGEMRISNFLLWQIAYAEIFITKTLWPDFNRDELMSILKEYQDRERRFGKV